MISHARLTGTPSSHQSSSVSTSQCIFPLLRFSDFPNNGTAQKYGLRSNPYANGATTDSCLGSTASVCAVTCSAFRLIAIELNTFTAHSRPSAVLPR